MEQIETHALSPSRSGWHLTIYSGLPRLYNQNLGGVRCFGRQRCGKGNEQVSDGRPELSTARRLREAVVPSHQASLDLAQTDEREEQQNSECDPAAQGGSVTRNPSSANRSRHEFATTCLARA